LDAFDVAAEEAQQARVAALWQQIDKLVDKRLAEWGLA
jgi:hypothetical protein